MILYSAKGQVCGTPIPQFDIAPSTNKGLTADGPFCIDIYYHIVRDSNGNGGINPSQLNDITANLNEFYNTHEIYFANSGINYIDNTSFQQISGYVEATYLAQEDAFSNAINYYIVESLWSTPGGYVTGTAIDIPSNKLVIRSDRVLTSTSPHEVGHCLNLYHTFEKYFCAEAINGSNCSSCGDLVCDTPADNGTGNIGGYSPDMTNIMSYYSFRNHFTDGQGTRMKNALANEPILSQIDSNNCSIPKVSGS